MAFSETHIAQRRVGNEHHSKLDRVSVPQTLDEASEAEPNLLIEVPETTASDDQVDNNDDVVETFGDSFRPEILPPARKYSLAPTFAITNISAKTRSQIETMRRRLAKDVERDLSFQTFLKKRLLRQSTRTPKCSAKVIRDASDPVTIYALTTQHMWTHMQWTEPPKTDKRWTSKCHTPCRVVVDPEMRKQSHVLWNVWDYDPPSMPSLLKHQKFAALAMEPHFGYAPSSQIYQDWFLADDDNYDGDHPVGNIDLFLAWAIASDQSKPMYDVSITYAYGTKLGASYERNGIAAEVEVRRRLSDKLKLRSLPVFDKEAFFNSLPPKYLEGPLDARGGDVAIFISNCADGVWRTQYLNILIPLLTAPPPAGYGLTVDSYGGCFGGFSIGIENWNLADIAFHGFNHKWSTTRRLNLEDYPDSYPWVKSTGGHKNGVDKDEMIRHYKVYLNFENTMSHNYVSEKFFQSVPAETVSMVFGMPSPDAMLNSTTAELPQSSWPHKKSNMVSGWKYTNPLDMALEINRLSTDEAYWLSHFEWRVPPNNVDFEFFQVPLEQGYVDAHLTDFVREDSQSWLCKICEWYNTYWDPVYFPQGKTIDGDDARCGSGAGE